MQQVTPALPPFNRSSPSCFQFVSAAVIAAVSIVAVIAAGAVKAAGNCSYAGTCSYASISCLLQRFLHPPPAYSIRQHTWSIPEHAGAPKWYHLCLCKKNLQYRRQDPAVVLKEKRFFSATTNAWTFVISDLQDCSILSKAGHSGRSDRRGVLFDISHWVFLSNGQRRKEADVQQKTNYNDTTCTVDRP
jgi:hypothetical protein